MRWGDREEERGEGRRKSITHLWVVGVVSMSELLHKSINLLCLTRKPEFTAHMNSETGERKGNKEYHGKH